MCHGGRGGGGHDDREGGLTPGRESWAEPGEQTAGFGHYAPGRKRRRISKNRKKTKKARGARGGPKGQGQVRGRDKDKGPHRRVKLGRGMKDGQYEAGRQGTKKMGRGGNSSRGMVQTGGGGREWVSGPQKTKTGDAPAAWNKGKGARAVSVARRRPAIPRGTG